MCNKITYTEDNAQQIIQNTLINHKLPLYKYYCYLCRNYHVTKYKNILENSLYILPNDKLYFTLHKAILNGSTHKKKISNRCTQHVYTINNHQYIYMYNKMNKSIKLIAELELKKEI